MTSEHLQMRWAGPHAVIGMPAEIDVTNAHQVHLALVDAASNDVPVLIIDMSKTTFCDSTGVRAIIAAYRHAAATGTQLRLVATAVRRVFTLTGVDGLIPVYPTLAAARTSAMQPECGSRR